LPHALLIAGQRGIGKFELARSFAASLLCEARTESGSACGRCLACGWLAQGNHPDLRLLQPGALAEGEESRGRCGRRGRQEESQSADHHRSGARAR
jgi:DNA polymerase-3 subunit delta'